MSGEFITNLLDAAALRVLAEEYTPDCSQLLKKNEFEFQGERWSFYSDHVIVEHTPPEALAERLFAYRSNISRVLLIPIKGKYRIFVGSK